SCDTIANTASPKQTDGVQNFHQLVAWLYPQGSAAGLGVSVEAMTEIGELLGLLESEAIHTATTSGTIGTARASVSPVLNELLNASGSEESLGEATQALINSFASGSAGLYLQTDLTAIAAGPIPNHLDFLLRDIA